MYAALGPGWIAQYNIGAEGTLSVKAPEVYASDGAPVNTLAADGDSSRATATTSESESGSATRQPAVGNATPDATDSSSRHSQVVTTGVYEWSLPEFLEALEGADVRLLLDVRQRRGVRGREYSWANSIRLQAALADAGVGYRHVPELAPTTELRHLQYAEDARQGVGKRSRVELAPEYRERYTREILDHFDLATLVETVPREGASALLCVERDPEACHRSIIAERLAAEYGVGVTHLRP